MGAALTGDQAIAAQSPLGVRYGNPKATQVTMVLATLNDPAVNAVTIDVNGAGAADVTGAGFGSPSWAQLGTDHTPDQLGWIISFDITGLNAFGTANSYTVNQPSNGSVSGNLVCAPAAGDDFILYLGTCENNYSSNYTDEVPKEPQATGMYRYIRDFAESPPPNHAPCAGIVMTDDICYSDAFKVDDSAGSGHVISNTLSTGPQTTKKAYDYALVYFCHMGMFEDSTQFEIAWGRNADRLWCQRNLPIMPQYGDHEWINDIGLAGNTRTSDAGRWTAGITPYDAIMKPLQGDSIQDSAGAANGDPNANHWAITLGDLKIVVPDGVYNGSGDGSAADALDPITNMLDNATAGESQIEDILTELDSTTTFKILTWPYQFRALGTGDKHTAGASWPYFNNNLAEFKKMFTTSGNTPTSWMDTAELNGTTGQGVLLMADFHNPHALHATKAAYDSELEEDIHIFSMGTITGSTNFDFPFDEGSTYNDCEVVYHADDWLGPSDGGSKPTRGFSVVRVDVFGSTTPQVMRVRLQDGRASGAYARWEWSKDFEI